MADLSSTKIYGTLTVVHDATMKGNLGGASYVADTPPSSPLEDQLWWDSSDGNMYIYYNDGTSSQWVQSVAPIKGDAATVSVGTTTTSAAGTNASVTNGGTINDAIFDFTIPRGDKGDKGDTGDAGPNPLDVLDVWQSTSDGVQRLYFAASSHTYLRTGADMYFRNSANTDMVTFSSAGNVVATGDITAYSDERMKMDIERIPDAIDKVNHLNGYTFNRTDMNGRHTGVIAQEVLDVLPEAVMGGPTEEDPDGKYSVAYGNMVGLLVEAIKDQQKQIDELTRRLG